MGFFPNEFSEYLAQDCNRSDFIQEWLESRGVNSNRVVIDGKNHILVQFGSSSYNPQFKIKTVIAHHDRVQESPGANDNSAADWQLMNWAVWLKDYPSFHNVRIFFTDGDNNVTVALDTNLTPELIEEGFVREIVSKIQTMRKDSGFEVMDNINIYCSGNDKIADIMERNADSIKSETLAVNIIFGSETHFSKNWNINGEDVVLGVEKINK